MDREDQPVPGASLRFSALTTSSAADGTFSLTIPCHLFDRFELGVGAKGFAPRCVALEEHSATGGPGAPLTIVLEPERSIVGRVLDEDLRPQAGWRVHLLDGQVVDDAPVPPVDAEDLVRGGLKLCVATDEQGRFVLNGVAERPYRVLACDPSTLVAAETTAAGGADSVVVRVESRTTPPLDGVLVAPDGTPVPWALVTPAIVPWRDQAIVPLESAPWTKTDEHGWFRIAALARSQDVCLVLGDRRVVPQATPIEALPDESPTRVTCRRFLQFRLSGWGMDDARWASLSMRATDGNGAELTLYVFEDSGWVFGPRLPAALARDSTAGVAETVQELEVLGPGAGSDIARIPMDGQWTEDVQRIDLSLFFPPR